MKRIRRALAHVCVALALAVLLLLYLDARNPWMAFLSAAPAKVYIACLCLLGMALAGSILADRGGEAPAGEKESGTRACPEKREGGTNGKMQGRNAAE